MLATHPVTVVFLKDVRSELRTRYALNALLMFVITTISMILFSIGNENAAPEILSGVLWVIVFFSAMSGLSRTFVSEEERGTVLTLQLLASPLTVLFGKLLFNFLLLCGINIVSVTLYLLLINDFVIQNYAIFIPTLFLGTIGLSSASTIIAAIISKANTKGTLFPVLSFPILLPLLLTVINATRKAVEGAPFTEAVDDLQALVAYFVAIIAVSYVVFEYVWKD